MLRRSLAPGFGATLQDVRGPHWWRQFRAAATVTVWAGRRSYRALRWLAWHPEVIAFGAVAMLLGWAVVRFGYPTVAGLLSVPCFAAYGWGHWAPDSYTRLLHVPVRSYWRRVWIYRSQWQPAVTTIGLSISRGNVEHLPRLGRVRSGPCFDTVRLRMLPGQTTEAWSKAGDQLAQTFGALQVRAYSVPGRPHSVELRCLIRDPLVRPVTFDNFGRVLPDHPAAGSAKLGENSRPAVGSLKPGCANLKDAVDLSAVPVGLREDGGALALPLLYAHLLVGGETGSGKGSVIWSLLCGAAPAIAEDRVRVLAIDPKGGMELTAGEPLFHRFVHEGPEEAARLLEHAVTWMRARAGRLRGQTRKFVPGPGEPLIVVVIDELAALTSYVTDTKLRKRITDALALLLSQGRAVGFAVLAATQDVRKETVGLRDLFPVRVALRAAEAEAADMLLGRGARERGALTDRIDARLPGVGFVMVDGVPEPVRARFAHVTDETIARVVGQYGKPTPVARQAS